jgi:hypothetical protein
MRTAQLPRSHPNDDDNGQHTVYPAPYRNTTAATTDAPPSNTNHDDGLMIFRGVQDLDGSCSVQLPDDQAPQVAAYRNAREPPALHFPQHFQYDEEQQFQSFYPPSIHAGDDDFSVVSCTPPFSAVAHNADLMQFYPEHITWYPLPHTTPSSSPASVSTVTDAGIMDRPPTNVLCRIQHHPTSLDASWPQRDHNDSLWGPLRRNLYICLGVVVVFIIAASAFVTTIILTKPSATAAVPVTTTNTLAPPKQPYVAKSITTSMPTVTLLDSDPSPPPPMPSMVIVTTLQPTFRSTVSRDKLDAPMAPFSAPSPMFVSPPTTTTTPVENVTLGTSQTDSPAVAAALAPQGMTTRLPTLAPQKTAPVSAAAPVATAAPQQSYTATHAIAFGTASTCNATTAAATNDDDDDNWDIDLTVSCSGSGVIRVEYAVNAICDPIGLLLTLSAAPPSRVGCRIENTSSTAAAALVPSVSTASVVITCVGPTMADVVASTEVPARAAGECPAVARRRHRRRLQSRTHQRKDMRHRRHRRAVAQFSPTNEGAASFVQMGRFCKSSATNEWMLWHQVYPCASGPRLLVTRAGAEWQGPVPTVPTWNATSSATTPTNRSTTSNLFGKFNSSSSSSGGSSGGASWQAAGVQSFCYNARWPCPPCFTSAANASCSSASATCSNRVAAVQMTNADARYSCVSAKDDAPSFIIMKQAVEAFSPLLFVDWMTKQLLVAT